MPIIRPDELSFLELNSFRLVPLIKSSKVPLEKSWEQSLFSAPDFMAKYGSEDVNVGLLTGGGLVDVDLDVPSRYLPFARLFLPSPAASFGRASKPASHYLYYCPDELPFQIIKSGAFSVEFRSSAKHQTMIPPSVHPSGESVIWSSPIDFSKVMSSDPTSPHKILMGIKLYVAACVLADVWSTGSRHHAALALSGMMLRIADNYPDVFPSSNHVVDFVKNVAEMASDDEVHDRVLAVKDTIKRWGGDETKLVGGNTLDKIFGGNVVKTVRNLLVEDTSFDIVEEMNKQFALTLIGDKVVVVWEDVETELGYRLASVSSFRLMLAGQKHTVTKAGKQKSVSLADLWLNHPSRRTCKNGIWFVPPGAKEVANSFNLFKGWKYQPVENTSKIEQLFEHIYENIASKDDKIFNWVISFFADIVQKPDNLPGVALVLRGEQGVGKTFVGNIMAELLSPYSISMNSPHSLLGHFNAHLQNKLLAVSNEAFFAGDRANVGKLKSIITDQRTVIERKGYDLVTGMNYLRLMMTTNSKWVIPAEAGERRYTVLDVANSRKSDKKFFGSIIDDMQSGGYEALMHYLINYKYDASILRSAIKTEALQEQKRLTASPVLLWWAECLESKQACLVLPEWAARGPGGEQSDEDWPYSVSKEMLYSDFVAHSQKNKYVSVDRSNFWAEFRMLLMTDNHDFKTHRFTVLANGRDQMTGQTWEGKRRMDFITMPPFAEALEQFEKIADFAPNVHTPSNVITLPAKPKPSREF